MQAQRAAGLLAAIFFLQPLLHAGSRSSAAAESKTQLQALDGTPHSIAELRGHPAVVNFWATWCGPCKEEMPLLQKLADAYAAQGVSFVAVSIDEPAARSKIPAVIERRGLKIPVWTGASYKSLHELQLGDVVPATVVLDDKGEVIGRIEGEARERDLRSRLDWLLGGRQGKAPKPVQHNEW